MEFTFRVETADRALGERGTAQPDGAETHQDAAEISGASEQHQVSGRRIGKACDECRRKKIKCDGSQPCQECRKSFFDCTYAAPRKRKARTQDVQPSGDLDDRLRLMETMVHGLHSTESRSEVPGQMSPITQTAVSPNKIASTASPPQIQSPHSESYLSALVSATGRLYINETQGERNYHGHASTMAFLEQLEEDMGQKSIPFGPVPQTCGRGMPQLFPTPCNKYCCRKDFPSLPPKEKALELVETGLGATFSKPFLHRPTFDERFERLYSLHSHDYDDTDLKYFRLLFSIMALGSLHCLPQLKKIGFREAAIKGSEYFTACQRLMNITECWDLVSLQTILFINIYLLGTSRTCICYSNLSFTLTLAVRMGYHRNIGKDDNLIERECRRRLFWAIRNIGILVSAHLGLPLMISEDEIDQQLPVELDDACITKDALLPMPPGHVPRVAALNATTKLLTIMNKISKNIYPIHHSSIGMLSQAKGYSVPRCKVSEIELDLQQWRSSLLPGIFPNGYLDPNTTGAQYFMQLAYERVRLMLYVPFSHHLTSPKTPSQGSPSSQYAFACIKTSKIIIDIAHTMVQRELLYGAVWSPICTIFIACMSLISPILSLSKGVDTLDLLEYLQKGRTLMCEVGPRCLLADRCSGPLNIIIEAVPEILRDRANAACQQIVSTTRSTPMYSSTNSGWQGDRTAVDQNAENSSAPEAHHSTDMPTSFPGAHDNNYHTAPIPANLEMNDMTQNSFPGSGTAEFHNFGQDVLHANPFDYSSYFEGIPDVTFDTPDQMGIFGESRNDQFFGFQPEFGSGG